MLQRFWIRAGQFLGWLLLALLLLGGAALLIGKLYYHWLFSGPVSASEQIPAGEQGHVQGIIEDAIRIAEQHRDNTRVLRDAHAKAHGCVRGELSVLPDLPAELRQGVFSQPGQRWQGWVRFSNGNAYPQFDATRDARGMAIKLLDVPGDKLLPGLGHDREQDFVMFNQPQFFVRDVAEYRQNFAAQADGHTLLAFFPSWDPRRWELRHLLIAQNTLSPAPSSPVSETYFSITPFKLGPHNIKFRVQPAPQNCPEYRQTTANTRLPNFLRSALYQQLSLDRSPACFELQVQVQDPARYMPLEDASVKWREEEAPFISVATLKLPAQDFDSREQNLFCDNLVFNPWHALPEHQPLGGINRLRKAVYLNVSAYRLQRNAVTPTPTVR